MPHTNRKKKSSAAGNGNGDTAVQTKRKQVEDTEGWTHVVGGGKNTGGGGGARTYEGDFMRGGVAYIERSVEEMKGEMEAYRKQWESSDAAKELKEILQGRNEGGVKSIVCLGLGSLQSAIREGRRSSFTQLAAVMMILEELGGSNNIQCIFQDPQYTETDKEFLTSLPAIVVDDPLAFGYINEDTLVYAIHCYAPVYKTITEGPRPAVMIGTDTNNFGGFKLPIGAGILTRHLDKMNEDCEIIDFPQLRHDFSDTKIYWRKKASVE